MWRNKVDTFGQRMGIPLDGCASPASMPFSSEEDYGKISNGILLGMKYPWARPNTPDGVI